MPRKIFTSLCALASVLALTPASHATWSIVIGDAETREVAVGTVTCLNSFDLLALVPVVVVGKGGGAVQSAGDFDGIRRPIIFEQLMMGTPPEEILEILEGISGHQRRQYGMVDTKGGKVTFSGSLNGDWAGGVIGSQCTMHYAIQGNVLAGACVVAAIEEAVLNTDGDIPAKLMAGMQAARAMGGDGRCSCAPFDPTSCGCPVPGFIKSGHIGGMVVARIGDSDDPECNAAGCVDGEYFMRLNVAFQSNADPDPVIQLQAQFDEWRTGLEGRPDAIQSTVVYDPPSIPPDGSSTTLMTITLLDWGGLPIDVAIQSLTVEHAPDSAGLSTIGDGQDNGDGTFSVTLTAGTTNGVDRFVVTVNDGIGAVILMPNPALEYCTRPDCLLDCNDNGIVDSCDIGDGFSQDCNDNLIPDECDISAGTSDDCNFDGTPDECEPDCNGNNIADSCDIAGGFSSDEDGNGVPDECHAILRVPTEFSTIQAAINDAQPGDTVFIADGTYTGEGNRNLDPGGKDILIKSENGPVNCIIDCQNSGRGFIFQSAETRSAIVEGLTIISGLADNGGAFNCIDNSNPTIRNCFLLANTADDKGGGVHSDNSSPLITRCAIIGNAANGFRGGGGVYADGFPTGISPSIDNCLLVGNTALAGGGVYVLAGSPEIRHCTFSGNTANFFGGGLYVTGIGNPAVINSILWGDTATQGPEIMLDGVSSSATVDYSNVAGGADAVVGTGSVNWGDGNIGDDPILHDPLFGDPDGPDDDPATTGDNDYHLLSGSPSIDAGDPGFVPQQGETDLDGNARVLDGDRDDQVIVDMGCYEFQGVELVLGLDIKPGSCPNPFNRHGNGVLPVALVGTADFDPTEVDLSSLQLSRADGIGGSVGPLEGPPGPHSVFEDVGTPFDGKPCDCHDLGGDGIDDLSMKFKTRDLVDALELDDLSGGALVELVLSGSLLDGTPFVAGDCIVIVPPGDLEPINATMGSNVRDTFIEVTPLDLNIDSDGFTSFGRAYYAGTLLTVTAPPTSEGRRFVRWMVDGVLQEIGVRSIEVAVTEDTTLQALYRGQRRLRPDRATESDAPLE